MLQVGIEEAEKIKKTYGSAKASMSSPELDFELPANNGELKRKISEHELSRYVEARMVEILQLLGSSSLMATPSEADFKNELKDDVKKYFQMINVDSKKRISLFRLAHDVCISGFGNRQALYERFFFGPPAIMKAGYFDLYQSKDLEERISSGEINNLTKKERLNIERQKDKLDLTLGGIKNI